jgi:hypothetical protein
MMIGFILAVVIGAVGGAYLLGRGSSNDSTTAGTTAATATTSTAATTAATQTQTVVTVTAPAETTATPDSTPAPAASITITEQSVNPATVNKGMPIALTVRTTGDVASVVMNINGPAAPGDIPLNKGPVTPSGITTWAASIPAPGMAGLYRYSATATPSSGAAVTAPIATFTVLP